MRILSILGAVLRFLRQWSMTHKFLLLSAAIPLIIRTIPEILAGPWPLGFDTVWTYAPFVRDVETKGLQSSLQGVMDQQVAPLMYVLLGLAATFTQAAPFVITKATAPLLHGFIGFTIYFFGRRGLRWAPQRSLLLVVVSTLYFVPLRFSWDMYKNTLGYGFFLLALSDLGRVSVRRGGPSVLLFAALSILASELTAVLLGATALVLVVWARVKGRRWDIASATVASTGGIALLYYSHVLVRPVLPATPLARLSPQSGFLYNYVGSNVDAYVYPALFDVYVSVFALTALMFAPILWLAVMGRFPEKRVLASSLVLGVGSFSLLVSPFAAIPAWNRWLYMLVFPGLIFATAGILRLNRRAQVIVVALLVFMGATFVAMPNDLALPYYTSPQTLRFIPPNLLRNTVGIQDSPDVVTVLEWLDDQGIPRAVCVANIWFVGWAKLYLDSMPVYEFVNRNEVDRGNFSDYDRVFTVYWAVGKGGYQSEQVPSGATQLFSIDRVAIYEIEK